MTRLPPFALPLAERQKFHNLPYLVVVCTGRNCWPRARRWNASPNDCIGLVYKGGEPPNCYSWPVSRCSCVVEWDTGPTAEQITRLISALLQSGASCVVSRPLFIDPDKAPWYYDSEKPIGSRWIQTREIVQAFAAANLLQGGQDAA